jgi:hypothetical protein
MTNLAATIEQRGTTIVFKLANDGKGMRLVFPEVPSSVECLQNGVVIDASEPSYTGRLLQKRGYDGFTIWSVRPFRDRNIRVSTDNLAYSVNDARSIICPAPIRAIQGLSDGEAVIVEDADNVGYANLFRYGIDGALRWRFTTDNPALQYPMDSIYLEKSDRLVAAALYDGMFSLELDPRTGHILSTLMNVK